MKEYISDVFICGSGVSGLCCAVASAREGKSVIVAEEDMCFGGSVVDYGVQLFCGRPIQGILKEVNDIMKEMDPRMEKCNAFTQGAYVYAWNTLMRGLPINIITDTRIERMETDGRNVLSVGSENAVFKAKCFVDSSGDGVLCRLAGCKMRYGREARTEFDELFAPPVADDKVQQCTLMYQIKKNRGVPYTERLNWAFFDDEEYLIWGPSVTCANTVDKEELRLAREKAMNMLLDDQSKRWAEKGCQITYIAPKIGVRESYRLDGRYMLSYRDVAGKKRFIDSIAVVNYLIDPWEPEGNPFHDEDKKKACETPFYEIPYRSLLPVEYDNLWVTGRCISATHVVNSSLRVMGIASVTGQSAGVAASLCIDAGKPNGQADTSLLRKKLRNGGVCVSLDEFEAKEEK